MLTFLSSFLVPTVSISHTTLRICLNTGKFHQKKAQQAATPELPYCAWKLVYCQQSSHSTWQWSMCPAEKLGRGAWGSFQTALDSSREHPMVARAADRVWAAALPSVTGLSTDSSKLAGSHPHSTYCISADSHSVQDNQGTKSPLRFKIQYQTQSILLSKLHHYHLGAQERRWQEILLGPKHLRTWEKSINHIKVSHQTSSPLTGMWANKLFQGQFPNVVATT